MKAQNPRVFCDKQREVCITIDLAIDPVEKKKRDQKIREKPTTTFTQNRSNSSDEIGMII